MKNILITGGSGMLGATLVHSLKDEFNIFSTGNEQIKDQQKNYLKFNLSSNSYDELINWSKPNVIIHCGAITNGNYCEENPSEAFDINGISVHKLLKATNNDVKIIYISTDAVFPSTIHLANEKDCVFPENVYGKSKELGEFFLYSSVNRNYTIIRTTIVGLNLNKERKGFVEWIINSARSGEKIGLFSDVLFTPITIWDLMSEIKFLIKSNNINSETLHIGGELCTKYQFGRALLETLNISTEKLIESSILSFKQRARRSNDQSLDSSYYQKKYNRRLPCLDEIILNIKKHYEKN